MNQDELSKHELKEQKRSEKEDSRSHDLKQHYKKKLTKKVIGWAIFAIIILGILFLFYRAINISKNFQPYTSGTVHWHADFNVKLCGQELDFSNLGGEAHHVGLPLLHTHGDNKVHIEGAISRPEEITIGRFFDAIGNKFTSTNFDDYTNDNDKCGGDNKIKFFVNSQENLQFENYVLKDGDIVGIIYE